MIAFFFCLAAGVERFVLFTFVGEITHPLSLSTSRNAAMYSLWVCGCLVAEGGDTATGSAIGVGRDRALSTACVFRLLASFSPSFLPGPPTILTCVASQQS